MLARSVLLLAVLCTSVAAEPYASWGTVKARAFGPPITIDPPRRASREATRVWISQIEVNDFDKPIFRRHVRRILPRLQYCYERELLSRLLPAGTITLELEILPNGGVRTATARGLDPVVAGCAAMAMIGIRFPASNRTTAITARVRIGFTT